MENEQEQRERAYRIWEDEGRPSGKHDEHWARAGQDRPLDTGEAEEITQANQTANDEFAGEQKEMPDAPLLRTSPD